MSRVPVDRIPVRRAWLGAPASDFAGNPTAWLFAAVVALLGLGTWSWFTGRLGAAAVIPLHAVAIYLGFTVLHEGMHGVAHRRRWVNETLARLAGIPLTVSLPLFRGVHHEHHSHTNDPARDPDLVVARRPRALLVLWCTGVLWEYRLKFYGHRLWRSRADLAEALAMDLAPVVVLFVAIAGGWWWSLVVLWFAPAWLAVTFLAFAFDFLPHHPYDSRERYFDTRVTPGFLPNVLLLGQNHHLIHHLWTTIPWYRYRAVFAEIRGDLVARGCRVGWRVTPLPPVARTEHAA